MLACSQSVAEDVENLRDFSRELRLHVMSDVIGEGKRDPLFLGCGNYYAQRLRSKTEYFSYYHTIVDVERGIMD